MMAALEPLKSQLLVLTGLQNTKQDRPMGDHAGGIGSFLSNRNGGVRPRKDGRRRHRSSRGRPGRRQDQAEIAGAIRRRRLLGWLVRQRVPRARSAITLPSMPAARRCPSCSIRPPSSTGYFKATTQAPARPTPRVAQVSQERARQRARPSHRFVRQAEFDRQEEARRVFERGARRRKAHRYGAARACLHAAQAHRGQAGRRDASRRPGGPHRARFSVQRDQRREPDVGAT